MKQKQNSMLPVIVLLLVMAIGVTAVALISISEEKDEEVEVPEPPNLYSSSQHVIGTGNKLGTYFPAGKMLADFFNSRLDAKGGSFKAFETNGSVDNIQLLQSGRIQFGMAEARIAKETYAKNQNIRVVWPLWLDVVQLLKPPADLIPNYEFPGKMKGFIGQKNSSTARTSIEIFEALGISGRHSVNIPTNRVLGAIGDGRLGFAMIQAGIPNQTVSDAIIFNQCGLVSFTPEQITQIQSKVSSSIPYNIQAGYYKEGQPEINTIGIPNVLVTTTETSPELVEYVTEMLVIGCPRLKSSFKAFDTVPSDYDIALKILEETGVPLHGGTKRWLEKNTNPTKEGDIK